MGDHPALSWRLLPSARAHTQDSSAPRSSPGLATPLPHGVYVCCLSLGLGVLPVLTQSPTSLGPQLPPHRLVGQGQQSTPGLSRGLHLLLRRVCAHPRWAGVPLRKDPAHGWHLKGLDAPS